MIFSCPRCGAELTKRIGKYRDCSKCGIKWDSRKMNRVCNHVGCNKRAVALCLDLETTVIGFRSLGVLQSMCEDHIIGRAIRIKDERTKVRARIFLVRGQKRRVIRKGEFPGQHLGY